MVEKKAEKNNVDEQIKKKVTKVDPDDEETNIHRLVQDENAKTILLNFPLEISTDNGANKPPKKPSPRPSSQDRKPPRPSEAVKRPKLSGSSARIRSASVGRDKKSDLQVKKKLQVETDFLLKFRENIKKTLKGSLIDKLP